MSEAIISKVKKLIALGTNAGAAEGERDNAMRMAHALLAKHNLSMNDLEVEDDRTEDFLDLWQDRYMIIAACSMAKLFFCYPYIQRKVGTKDLRMFFVGRRDNVETAKVMSEYVIKSIRSEMNKNKMGSSFSNGAATRIHQRVLDIINNTSASEEISQSMALAVVGLHKNEEAANQDFIASKGTQLVESKKKKLKVDPKEYEAGRQFGDKVNFNRQVGGTTANARLK